MKKKSPKECVFVNLVLNIQCRVVKNTLLSDSMDILRKSQTHSDERKNLMAVYKTVQNYENIRFFKNL